MLFGVQEMKEFAESSNDARIKSMWRKIEESRSKSAKWCESNENMKKLLRQIANSPVDLVNDGECCMRIKSTLIVEARTIQ